MFYDKLIDFTGCGREIDMQSRYTSFMVQGSSDNLFVWKVRELDFEGRFLAIFVRFLKFLSLHLVIQFCAWTQFGICNSFLHYKPTTFESLAESKMLLKIYIFERFLFFIGSWERKRGSCYIQHRWRKHGACSHTSQ